MEPFVMILFPIHISSIPNENQRKKGKVVLTNSVTVGSLVTSCYCMKQRGQTKSNKVKPFLYFSLWLTFYFKVFFTFAVHLIYIDTTVSQVNMKSIFSRKWNVFTFQTFYRGGECYHVENQRILHKSMKV